MKQDEYFEQKRQETQQLILDAALHYFAQNGINHNVQMKEIAAAAGTSRQNLYKYYRNLDELLCALAAKLIHEGQKTLQEQMSRQQHTTALTAILALLETLLQNSLADPESTVFLYHFDAYRHHVKQQQQSEMAYPLEHFHTLEDEILRGQAAGEIRAEIDPAIANVTIGNLLAGIVTRLGIAGDVISTGEMLQSPQALAAEFMTMVRLYLQA